MRLAGTRSWRFAEGIEQIPLVALFVRDAYGLTVPDDPVVPPRLDGRVPDPEVALDPQRRAEAGAAWTRWWQDVVAREARHHLHDPGDRRHEVDPADWARQVAQEHRRLDAGHSVVFDPPEFTGFADRPALRDALRATYPQAVHWADSRRRALPAPPAGQPGQFEYRAVSAAAKRAAREHRVSPGAVRGCATVLPVQGIWWHRVAPGAVVCSIAAANDPPVARSILADAFESGLHG